jgi:hypothetical protein
MEIVCASLTGINKVLKEIDFDPKSPTFLTNDDFHFKKRVNLTKIEVLSPEYFDKMKEKEKKNF